MPIPAYADPRDDDAPNPIGPRFGRIAILQTYRVYEEAAGVNTPSPELRAQLNEVTASSASTLDSKGELSFAQTPAEDATVESVPIRDIFGFAHRK
jgi:hypothetical protein